MLARSVKGLQNGHTLPVPVSLPCPRSPPPALEALHGTRAVSTGPDAFGLDRPPWHADALCREYPEARFFPAKGEHGVVRAARLVCGRCLCRDECLAFALADSTLVGVWGGTTARQRAVMRREVRAG